MYPKVITEDKMHIIGEVITNLNKNKVLTITSVFTVFIMLLLVGFFGLFLLTVSYNSDMMDDMLEIRIFIDPEADEYREARLKEALIEDDRIIYLEFESKEDAFNMAKLLYDKDTIEGLGSGFLPASYMVRLKENENANHFVAFAESLTDVYKVDYHEESFDFVASISKWVNIVMGTLALVLGLLSLFLISNTIHLTMASRKDEVAIMKFIGATENRIKIPFIMEGVTIGFTGALGASLLVAFLYNKIYIWFNTKGMEETFLSGIKLIEVKEAVLLTVILFFAFGIMLGMFGSIMAIRKHLRV